MYVCIYIYIYMCSFGTCAQNQQQKHNRTNTHNNTNNKLNTTPIIIITRPGLADSLHQVAQPNAACHAHDIYIYI